MRINQLNRVEENIEVWARFNKLINDISIDPFLDICDYLERDSVSTDSGYNNEKTSLYYTKCEILFKLICIKSLELYISEDDNTQIINTLFNLATRIVISQLKNMVSRHL